MGIKSCLPPGMLDYLRKVYRGRGILYFLYRSTWDHAYPLLCIHSLYWQARAAMAGEPLAHFIGDSHTDPFRFCPRIITHHIGQATAHNLVKENSSSGSKEIFWRVESGINRKRDIIVLVFGEIDCRMHFHYQFLKQKKAGRKAGMDSLMDATIANYGSVMDALHRQGARFAVLSVTPAARQENIYGYPFFGSPSERSAITRRFNQKLAGHCRKKGYPFIDAYSVSSDKNGFVKKDFARDDVHLNGKVVPFVTGELNRLFGLRLPNMKG